MPRQYPLGITLHLPVHWSWELTQCVFVAQSKTLLLLASVKKIRISALTDAALYGRSGSIRAFRLDGIKYALKNEKTVVKSKRFFIAVSGSDASYFVKLHRSGGFWI